MELPSDTHLLESRAGLELHVQSEVGADGSKKQLARCLHDQSSYVCR